MSRVRLALTSIVLITGLSTVWIESLTVRAQKIRNSNPPKAQRGVVIEFIRFISNAENVYAQYRVTNFGPQPVRFPGFAGNSNCMVLFKQGALIRQTPATWGTHHFGTYSLMPGKTFVYDVQIPDTREPFEIGFGYEIGPRHRWVIAWSKTIDYPTNAGNQ